MRNTLEMLHLINQNINNQKSSSANSKRKLSNVQKVRSEIEIIHLGNNGYGEKLKAESNRLREEVVRPAHRSEIDEEILRL